MDKRTWTGLTEEELLKKHEEMGEANNSDKDRLETLEERLEKLRKREKELTDKEEQELTKQKEILHEIQTMKVRGRNEGISGSGNNFVDKEPNKSTRKLILPKYVCS